MARPLAPCRSAGHVAPSLGVLALAGLVALTACDNNATITPNPLLYKELQIVSAYPARLEGGELVKACDGSDVDGVLLNVAFLSFARDENTSDPAATDRDRSIRPKDVVKGLVVEGGNQEDINLTKTGNIALDIDCVDPVPDADDLSSLVGHSCQGSQGGATIDEAWYQELGEKRRDGHNVLVLLDESGSIKGLVNEGDFVEGSDIELTTDFLQVASDYNHVRRTTIKTRFTDGLNAEDRLGIIAFGENVAAGERLKIPCTAAAGSVTEDLEECFGVNRDLWSYTSLQTNPGRSNLWEAVDFAWDFLVEEDDSQRSNHIVVFTDGPDTCSPSAAFTNCDLPCSSGKGFEEILAKVEAANNDPNALPIHIHFVQFESKGYRGRDARQMELACLTSGHYQFINNVDMSTLSPAAFEEALNAAADNVRFSLMGFWQFAVETVGYQLNSLAPNGSPPGSLYAMEGTFTLTQATNLVEQDFPHLFGIGAGSQATSSTNWDRRPTVLKACGGPVDCGASDAAQTECLVYCSEQTRVCSEGTSMPTSSECTANDGSSGICCSGSCLAAGNVCQLCVP